MSDYMDELIKTEHKFVKNLCTEAAFHNLLVMLEYFHNKNI